MKLRCLALLLVLGAALPLFPQASSTGPMVVEKQGAGNLVKVIPLAPVVVCADPATGGTPCTNLATTYTDRTAGTNCVTPAQVVSPATNVCRTNADAAGNFQFFASAGNYDYYFQDQGTGAWSGPFVVVLGSSSITGGTVTSVSGTTNQIDVATGTLTPVVSIHTNPTLPGNVSVGGTLNISGASLTAFSKTFTGVTGNGANLVSGGTIAGTSVYVCTDNVGGVSLTTTGCPAIATVPGSTTEVPFRNAGAFTSDTTFFFTAASHTLSVQNQTITGTQNFTGGTYTLAMQIPVGACSAATFTSSYLPGGLVTGFTGICINNDGLLAECIGSTGVCTDLATTAGVIPSGTTNQQVVYTGTNTIGGQAKLVFETRDYAGATSDIRITNAIAAMPAGGGVLATTDSTNQSWAACPTWGSNPVHLILNPVTYTVAVNCSIPANVTVQFRTGAFLNPANSTTTTILANIQASTRKIFSNIASGQGALSFNGNVVQTTYNPVWFGLDCGGAVDNAPMWNQLMSFTGDNAVFVLPTGCRDMHASTVTVSSRDGFKLKSETREQVAGGNVNPTQELWMGSTGGMWDFQANQAPTVEGLAFINGGTNHLDYFLRFDGNPSTYIGTEAMVRYNTFTNNMTNPGTFTAVTINFVSGQNHEKNVITDNDFFCSQSRSFRESNSTVLNSGSNLVACGLANCSYLTDASVGDRVRISYAAGILDTTIQSITDNNHLVTVANATSNQTNARITFRQAYGYGIGIGSTNAKHNTLERDSFTQCERGLYVLNGSFSAAHFGGSANDTLAYITNIAESSELAYLEDESAMRDVWIAGPLGAPLTISHQRISLASAGEYDGFDYFGNSAVVTMTDAIIQDPLTVNQVVIGINAASTPQLTSIDNYWGVAGATMATIGFAQFRTRVEALTADATYLISCGDIGIADQPGLCFQFGDGGALSSTEGHLVVSSGHGNNLPSYNSFTAEPNVQSIGFVNEARGFKTNFNGFNLSTSALLVGHDAQFLAPIRGGNFAGYRAGFPTVNSTQMPFARGLWIQAPTAATNILTGTGVYVEDLNSFSGITNKYTFYGVGALDIAHFGGPLEVLGASTLANLNAYRNPIAKTSNFSVLAGQSGGFLNNTAAVGEVDFTLPACSTSGYYYTFYIDNAQIEKVIASGGAKIRNAATLSAANGNITAAITGNSVTLQCLGTSGADSVAEWNTTAIIGTWTIN